VGHPGGIILSGGPVHVAISPTRAAGMLPIKTVGLPIVMGPPTCGVGGSGGGGGGLANGQVCISPIRAAGIPPIKTVGNPTVMTPPWAVGSPILAAGIGMNSLLDK